MATNVVMPQLGESVTEGTVTRWLKNVGDAIKVDEAIVEVSTDKVDTEIPSPVAGVLLEIKAAQDAVIPVGGVMAIIGESGSVDKDLIERARIEIRKILDKYSLDDIYNLDETALFYQLPPNKTIASKKTRLEGTKLSKKRLSVAFCVNASGKRGNMGDMVT